jgi:hypothetical protein
MNSVARLLGSPDEDAECRGVMDFWEVLFELQKLKLHPFVSWQVPEPESPFA